MSEVPDQGGIAILSSASAGGAGIAAKRLAEAMQAHARGPIHFINSAGLGGTLPADVAKQTSYSNRTISSTHFSYEHTGFARGWVVEMLSGYDALNIHWASYLLSLAEIDAVARAGKPLIFTLHDFHYLTGGCHYPAGCDGFTRGCHICPQVDRDRATLAQIARNHAIKREILARPNVQIIAPSAWLRDKAVDAGLIDARRAHVVRNPYDPLFPPMLGRLRDGLRILLIADSLDEERKQMPLALEALRAFADDRARRGDTTKITLDLVGRPDPALAAMLHKSNLILNPHGRVTNHTRLSQIFARTDMVMTCSNEDNWPNILVEAGVYGALPVVGPGHGSEEFVRHYNFGQVAADYSVPAFVDALTDALGHISADITAPALARIRDDHAPDRIALQMEALLTRQGAPEINRTIAAE